MSLFGHKHCRIVYHLLQYKDEEDCTLRPGPAAEVAASLFLVPHTPLSYRLACLAGGRPVVTAPNLFINGINVSSRYNWDSLFNSVLPYMEKI